MSVNKNEVLIRAAIAQVEADANEYGYDCDLNEFHLQLMLDCYVERGISPNEIVRQMKAGGDTTRAFWAVIRG